MTTARELAERLPRAWIAEGPGWGRVFLSKEAAEKLAAQGGKLVPLYAALSPSPDKPASGASELAELRAKNRMLKGRVAALEAAAAKSIELEREGYKALHYSDELARAEAAEARLAASPQGMVLREADETGWLVELKGHTPQWAVVTPDWEEHWTSDASKALRFARKEDAEAYIDHIGWTEAFASEHVWCSPRASLTSTAEQGEASDLIKSLSTEPCEYCGEGKRTGLPGNACENCMNTGLKYQELSK